MTTLRITCDRCGAVIDAGRVKLAAECGATPSIWPRDPGTGRPCLDLCPPCLDALDAWLAGGAGPLSESPGSS